MIAGIDPGLSGAFAVIGAKGVEGKLGLDVYDMPTYTQTVSGKQRRRLDMKALSLIFDYYRGTVSRCVIEEVGAMPNDGPIQAFSFGKSAGAVEMGSVMSAFPIVHVRPAVWKIQLGLGGNKEDSRRLAMKLFPAYANLFKRVKDDGRAEAVLLAYYGSRIK